MIIVNWGTGTRRVEIVKIVVDNNCRNIVYKKNVTKDINN